MPIAWSLYSRSGHYSLGLRMTLSLSEGSLGASYMQVPCGLLIRMMTLSRPRLESNREPAMCIMCSVSSGCCIQGELRIQLRASPTIHGWSMVDVEGAHLCG